MFSRVDMNRPYVEPARKHWGDAGYDLHAPCQFVVAPYCGRTVPLNVRVDLPAGWFGIVQERSSQGTRGIETLGNVVDEGYEGEIGVTLHNNSSAELLVREGDRVAQLVLVPRFIDPREHLLPKRGLKGFGSTGR
jgi:dUTP pyrophosphatase